jgi:hypothetical protein
MIPVSIAFKNVIEIPGISQKEIQTINPLTISINKPRVTNIAGSDNMTIKGFNTALTTENISPAPKNPTILIPTWVLS